MTKKAKTRVRKPRIKKRTPRSAIKTEITELRAQAREAKKFMCTKSCTKEDANHMSGFLVGLDYGLRSLEILHVESVGWCEK